MVKVSRKTPKRRKRRRSNEYSADMERRPRLTRSIKRKIDQEEDPNRILEEIIRRSNCESSRTMKTEENVVEKDEKIKGVRNEILMEQLKQRNAMLEESLRTKDHDYALLLNDVFKRDKESEELEKLKIQNAKLSAKVSKLTEQLRQLQQQVECQQMHCEYVKTEIIPNVSRQSSES